MLTVAFVTEPTLHASHFSFVVLNNLSFNSQLTNGSAEAIWLLIYLAINLFPTPFFAKL